MSRANDDHHLVAPDDAAVRVDDADAVGVAVERDAEVGAGLAHGFAIRSARFSSTVGSGWWLGKRRRARCRAR